MGKLIAPPVDHVENIRKLIDIIDNEMLATITSTPVIDSLDHYYNIYSDINDHTPVFKKFTAVIKGHQFLVVGNNSYNLEQLTKFEVKEDQIVIVLGALTYAIFEQNVKNFKDIPDIIYGYFEHKQGKQM